MLGAIAVIAVFGIVLLDSTITASPIFPIASTRLSAENDDVRIRLPNDTIPIHYTVKLTTRIHDADFTYDGQVTVAIKCVEATNVITLHNRVNVISAITLVQGADPITVTQYTENTESEFLTISLGQQLVVGQEYVLTITFTGTHTVDSFGWYRASYTNADGQTV